MTPHSTHFYSVLTADEAAWLNVKPNAPVSFTDRCAVVRAESYKQQRERNARFEHLRNLLCKPAESPAIEPKAPATPDWAARRRQLLNSIAAEAPASTRCTCRCRVRNHREWVCLDDTCSPKVWGAGDPEQLRAAYAAGEDVVDCPDCYADRILDDCPATHHWRSLEEPDSYTVRTDEDDAQLVHLTSCRVMREKERNAFTLTTLENVTATHPSPRYSNALHNHWGGCCEMPERREPETTPDSTASDAVTKLTGIRDLDKVRELRGPKHALLAVNPNTRYVTVQYGAKKPCRVTMNSTLRTLTVMHPGLDKPKRSKPYASLDALEEARDRIAEWLLENWHADERSDIQQARSTQYATPERMWTAVRNIRDLMAARGIDTRVWNPLKQPSAA